MGGVNVVNFKFTLPSKVPDKELKVVHGTSDVAS